MAFYSSKWACAATTVTSTLSGSAKKVSPGSGTSNSTAKCTAVICLVNHCCNSICSKARLLTSADSMKEMECKKKGNAWKRKRGEKEREKKRRNKGKRSRRERRPSVLRKKQEEKAKKVEEKAAASTKKEACWESSTSTRSKKCRVDDTSTSILLHMLCLL